MKYMSYTQFHYVIFLISAIKRFIYWKAIPFENLNSESLFEQ